MKIMLATPLGSGATAQYVSSVVRFVEQCTRTRPDVQLASQLLKGSVIYRSRNVLANIAVSEDYTHLLFIDADMGFEPSAVFKLIDSGHDVSGAIYPSRLLDLDPFFHASKRAETPADALHAACDFIGEQALIAGDIDGRRGYEVRHGFIETNRIGMGLALIKIDALLRLRAALPDLKVQHADGFYDRIPNVAEVSLFFDPMPRPGCGVLGEDYSFCERWTGIGGRIFALVDEAITHVGERPVQGTGLRRLMAKR